MARQPRKRCPRCGSRSVCPCRVEIKRRRNAQRTQHSQILFDHLQTHGPVCPGYRRPEHDVQPDELTVDDIIPIAVGGNDSPENKQVLCRACNTAKRNRGL